MVYVIIMPKDTFHGIRGNRILTGKSLEKPKRFPCKTHTNKKTRKSRSHEFSWKPRIFSCNTNK
jgi:hypothetical protein